MKHRAALFIAIVFALWLAVAPARAGGWAVVTLEEWPEDVRAGEAFTIMFSVRQHGQALMSGYEPVVRAHLLKTGERLEVVAHETKRTGFYAAEVTFPTAGEWSWSISYHGGADFAQPMPKLAVAPAGSIAGRAANAAPVPYPGQSLGYVIAAVGALTLFTGGGFYAVTRSRAAIAAALAGVVVIAGGLILVPRAQAAAETPATEPESAPVEDAALYDHGRDLFVAKGCIVCHGHAELHAGYTGIAVNIGPDFTWGTKRPVEFLRSWLADPQYFIPDTAMPNLELSESEIEALAAFLMGELGP